MRKHKTQATKNKLPFLLNFNVHIHEVQISHLEPFRCLETLDFQNFRAVVSDKDLILKCFFLQMLNDKMFKPNNEICLKCEYHFKQKIIK